MRIGNQKQSRRVSHPPGGALNVGSFWQAEGMHVLFKTAVDGATGHVHLDYRKIGQGHYDDNNNSDIRRIGPDKLAGKPINNYEVFKGWYGPIRGFEQ